MAEHTSNSRPSNLEKHEKGQATYQRDHDGEKADSRRVRYRDYVQPKDKK